MAKKTPNTKFFLTAIVLLGCLSLFILYFPDKKSKDAANSVSPQNQSAGKLLAQAKAHKGLEVAHLSEAEKKGVCKDTLSAIETLPLKTLLYDLNNGTLKLDPKCFLKGKNSAPILAGFPEVCVVTAPQEASKECAEKLFFYKALRIYRATQGENPASLSTELLISQVIGLIGDEALNRPKGIEKFREVAEELYERLPQSESAAKAVVLGYFVDDKIPPDDQAAFDKMLAEAREKFPENWEIYEMDIIRKRQLDPEAFKKEVQRFHSAYPNSAIGLYYVGCNDWSEGRALSARGYFKSASANAPADVRMRETLKKSLVTEPPEKVCAVTIGFDPEKF